MTSERNNSETPDENEKEAEYMDYNDERFKIEAELRNEPF